MRKRLPFFVFVWQNVNFKMTFLEKEMLQKRRKLYGLRSLCINYLFPYKHSHSKAYIVINQYCRSKPQKTILHTKKFWFVCDHKCIWMRMFGQKKRVHTQTTQRKKFVSLFKHFFLQKSHFKIDILLNKYKKRQTFSYIDLTLSLQLLHQI